MLTNDLRKGAYVKLASGMEARIEDNKKGNIRLCTVYGEDVGMFTEMGSVYAHDMRYVLSERHGDIIGKIELTDKQRELKNTVSSFF